MDIKYNVSKLNNSKLEEIKDSVSVEEPLEMRLRYKKNDEWKIENISITMRTPGNDKDLIKGFLFNERIIKNINDIKSIEHQGEASGDYNLQNIIEATIINLDNVDIGKLKRNFVTNSSCGICGKTSLDAVEVIKDNKYLSFLGNSLFHEDLWKFNRISFCRAIAIGVFLGWMPMLFQMIPAAYFAVVFRANLPISLAGVWISNPITMPPMMYFAYLFGNELLGLNPVYDNFAMDTDWIMSALGNIWEPLLFGCVIIGIFSSILSYIIMHILWKIYAYRRLKKIIFFLVN